MPPIVAMTLLGTLAAGFAEAHELSIEPVRRSDGTRTVRPVIVGSDHLSAAPSALAFGSKLIGQSETLPVDVTNVGAETVTVVAGGPTGYTVSPSGFTLGTGQTQRVDVTLTATQETSYDGQVSFGATHAGLAAASWARVDVTGQGVTPAELRFDVPAFGLTDVTTIDFGLVSLLAQLGSDPPTFDVVIKNLGGSTAEDVRVIVTGPGATISGYGVCHEGLNEASICVSKRLPDGTVEAVTFLGALPPGGEVTTAWRIVPANSGEVAKPFDVTSTTAPTKTLTVTGEVIPFTTPGVSFLTNKAGEPERTTFSGVDLLADDQLGTLRPASFDARTVFDLGQTDSVDLRTGNLTFLVPIGSRRQVRGPLSYQLTAVFNGHLWHRRTMGETTTGGGEQGRPKVKSHSAEYPNPAFNLGSGWSFHLGRLLPPFVFDGYDIDATACQIGNLLGHEKKVDTGQRFVYIDPNGTQHEFWLKLHGEELPSNPGSDPLPNYLAQTYLYARDGSHLRLFLESATRRWVEEPGGIRRLFVKVPSPHPTLPDSWQLREIRDQYQNKVSIVYGNVTVPTDGGGTETVLGWKIREHQNGGSTFWREVLVAFGDWTGRTADDPMVVEQVVLPGFGGGAGRRYVFRYTDLLLDRPARSAFHTVLANFCTFDARVRMPRLDRIELPDGSRYTFGYDMSGNDQVQLTSAALPSGGTVAYEYQDVWDSPPDCVVRQIQPKLPGISRRTVSDPGGQLEDRRYLRQTLRTPDVPEFICQVHQPNNQSVDPKPPWSEQKVVVWSDLGEGQSSASTHYFNVYPFSDDCGTSSKPECSSASGGRFRLTSGRSHRERNLKISHTVADPLDSSLSLSEELYACPFPVDGRVTRDESPGGTSVGDQLSILLDACERKETVYAKYEVALAGLCREASPHCLRDSRLVASRTVFQDDASSGTAKWVKTTKSDYDGLGHYRATATRSNFQVSGGGSTLEQTTFKNWNAGKGTLVLDADHRVTQTVNPPATWLLETFREHWTIEGAQGRGGEACFHALGHQTFARTWNRTAIDTNSYTANRTADDLVVKNAVDSNGELDLQRFFGADTLNVPITGGWCSSGAFSSTNQDYGVNYDYQFGVLSKKNVIGETVDEIDRTIDQATGWTATERLDSGEVKTFVYDSMGRAEWITSPLTASRRFIYQHQADGRWQLTARIFPKNSLPGTSATPIRQYVARYDGLGRLRAEDLPKWNGPTVTRTVSYLPNGQIHKVSALDNPLRHTTLSYDFRSRVDQQENPDGSKLAWIHTGDRKTRARTCVATGSTNHQGICTAATGERAETIIERDWKGRTFKITSPVGFFTTFTYDPYDNRTSAQRSGGLGQTRQWTYDGVGFLTRERIPERVDTVLSDFNTRGQARRLTESGRVTNRTYDRLGRLRELEVDNETIKTFAFATSGPANGQVIDAERFNRRDSTNSGVPGSGSGAWRVASSFGYDAAGRPSSRSTAIRWQPDSGTASTDTTFNQSWTYDDLGNVETVTYPNCLQGGDPNDPQNPPTPCAADRTVRYAYRQGFYLRSVDGDTALSGRNLGAAISYHASGLVSQVVHSEGHGTDNYGVANGMTRIASIDLAVGATGRLNLGGLSYDGTGNITAIGGDTFLYDKNSRLAASTVRGVAKSYGYDNFDNHLIGFGTRDVTTNRLTGGVTTYDDFGNLIKGPVPGGALDAVYDEHDKLIAVDQPGGIEQLSIYDHADLRVMQLRQPGNQVTWTLRDGSLVIRDLKGVTPNIQLDKDYIYAGDRLIASKAGDGTVRHYHEDQLGTARLITTTGGTPKQVHYQPFGTDASSGERAVGFTGHEDDGLTTYMRGRTYLPLGARFMQVDPGRDESSWSLYAYAANNPVQLIDPSGNIVVVANRPVNDAPIASHAYIIIYPTPKNKDHFKDRVNENGVIILSGGPGLKDGEQRLVKWVGRPGSLDTIENAAQQLPVEPLDQPRWMFERNVVEAFDSYQEDKRYRSDASPGNYNSNSLVSGVLDAAGASSSDGPFGKPSGWELSGLNPGWGKPVPLQSALSDEILALAFALLSNI